MSQMIRAAITKQRIGEVRSAIEAGDPIGPTAPTWTLIDFVTVAGVLVSAAMSAGSQTHLRQPGTRGGPQKLLQDLQGAIEFVGAMANAYGNGTWDEYFERTVVIAFGEDGLKQLGGFKGGPQGS